MSQPVASSSEAELAILMNVILLPSCEYRTSTGCTRTNTRTISGTLAPRSAAKVFSNSGGAIHLAREKSRERRLLQYDWLASGPRGRRAGRSREVCLQAHVPGARRSRARARPGLQARTRTRRHVEARVRTCRESRPPQVTASSAGPAGRPRATPLNAKCREQVTSQKKVSAESITGSGSQGKSGPAASLERGAASHATRPAPTASRGGSSGSGSPSPSCRVNYYFIRTRLE